MSPQSFSPFPWRSLRRPVSIIGTLMAVILPISANDSERNDNGKFLWRSSASFVLRHARDTSRITRSQESARFSCSLLNLFVYSRKYLLSVRNMIITLPNNNFDIFARKYCWNCKIKKKNIDISLTEAWLLLQNSTRKLCFIKYLRIDLIFPNSFLQK